MDGLAGTMAVVGFGALWWASGSKDTLPLITVGACLGFLVFNRHPARVFMGDSGSTMLGMLAAAISIIGIHNGSWTWPIPVLIFLPFVYDATSTLVVRILAGKRVWQAHREHMYQRAVLAGYSVNAVWRCSTLLMLLSAASALWVRDGLMTTQLIVLLVASSGFVVLQMWLYRLGRKTTETS
jgi:UDP-GlcNAc:undecaprenyl-phosphate/decaprenyl-phosphate GlcNAc-1-phosphate transferase